MELHRTTVSMARNPFHCSYSSPVVVGVLDRSLLCMCPWQIRDFMTIFVGRMNNIMIMAGGGRRKPAMVTAMDSHDLDAQRDLLRLRFCGNIWELRPQIS